MNKHKRIAYGLALAAAVILLLVTTAAAAGPAPDELAGLYRAQVDRRLEVPAGEQRRYQRLAEEALWRAQADLGRAQYLLVVDRDPWVQATLLLWRGAAGDYRFIGASPVSTGRPGEFDHFETPTGVFDHTPANPDYRAEGTLNANGIRGYGVKGMRVFDFGWQRVPKGWGDGAAMDMRLQLHATDPELLEPRLGSAQSKGCVRVPASLNALLDHFGVLDFAYEQAAASGIRPGVMKDDQQTVADPGRYLVVVDSQLGERADWSPAPYIPRVRRPATPAR